MYMKTKLTRVHDVKKSKLKGYYTTAIDFTKLRPYSTYTYDIAMSPDVRNHMRPMASSEAHDESQRSVVSRIGIATLRA